ncbi:MAG TPA: MliC family protein [Deinococcales bacterium]|nr:MliC family protein [Deinococcales bacterium]
MKNPLLPAALAALMLAAVPAGAQTTPAKSAYPTVSYTVHKYTCAGGITLTLSYLKYGPTGPNLAVLDYNGKQTGLAQAPSADGARYATLGGLQPGDYGLEWWSKGRAGTLSTLNRDGSKITVATGCLTPR